MLLLLSTAAISSEFPGLMTQLISPSKKAINHIISVIVKNLGSLFLRVLRGDRTGYVNIICMGDLSERKGWGRVGDRGDSIK